MQILNTIAQYDMNQEEATAYKLACLYQSIAQKVFPDYFHYRFGKSDPRKTSLFKYCYKLLQDTKEKLNPAEYSLYIRAQMDIFKALAKDGDQPLVQPSCLVGEKAWNRWLVWKKHYEIKKKKFAAGSDVVDVHKPEMVKHQIKSSHEFLVKRLGNIEKIQEAISDKRMMLWVKTHQVSGYYAAASPLLRNLDFGIDLDYYRPGITPEIEKYFTSLKV